MPSGARRPGRSSRRSCRIVESPSPGNGAASARRGRRGGQSGRVGRDRGTCALCDDTELDELDAMPARLRRRKADEVEDVEGCHCFAPNPSKLTKWRAAIACRPVTGRDRARRGLRLQAEARTAGAEAGREACEARTCHCGRKLTIPTGLHPPSAPEVDKPRGTSRGERLLATAAIARVKRQGSAPVASRSSARINSAKIEASRWNIAGTMTRETLHWKPPSAPGFGRAAAASGDRRAAGMSRFTRRRGGAEGAVAEIAGPGALPSGPGPKITGRSPPTGSADR
jgi:hypothetical protein